jgi:hypothetical protein
VLPSWPHSFAAAASSLDVELGDLRGDNILHSGDEEFVVGLLAQQSLRCVLRVALKGSGEEQRLGLGHELFNIQRILFVACCLN